MGGWRTTAGFLFGVSKSLLGCIHHVEEAILVLLSLIQLSHGHGDAGHAALVDQQEEGLIGIQLHASPVSKKNNKNNKMTSAHCNAVMQ